MNKIFNTKNTKIAKKQLNNYNYVMRIASLTPIERDILSKKYRKGEYKIFPISFRKIKRIDDAKQAFQQAIYKIEKFIKDENLQEPHINNKYHNNSLVVRGYYLLSDRELIRKLQTDAKRIKKSNDAMIERKRIAKQYAISQAARWAAEDQKRKDKKTVVICSTSEDAKEIINQLKSKFNI